MDEDPSPRWNNDGGDDGGEYPEQQDLADDDGETWFDADYNHNDYGDAAWADY